MILLGAGASCAAKTRDGKQAPTTRQLGALLADKFIGGKYKDAPLHQIAEYAISESDLGAVQTFIRDTLDPLEPTDAHLRLCDFGWHGIATTNYDRLIEKAYESNKDSIQSPRPLIEDTDKVEDNLRQQENVLVLKLHGCITRVANPLCPLILTVDQYVEHRRGRDRLFEILMGWGYEHPIVFIGSSLQDADIRKIVLELTQNIGDFRPRYYVVAPDVDDHKRWDGSRPIPSSDRRCKQSGRRSWLCAYGIRRAARWAKEPPGTTPSGVLTRKCRRSFGDSEPSALPPAIPLNSVSR